jgi:hypothetical protein
MEGSTLATDGVASNPSAAILTAPVRRWARSCGPRMCASWITKSSWVW